MRSVWIGYDPREAAAFAVARYTLNKNCTQQIQVRGLVLDDLMAVGLYKRPTETRINSDGHKQLWDVISEAPMATQFSISRFLVPRLAKQGWAMFEDCDVLHRGNVARLFDLCDPSKAVMCVQHKHDPKKTVKMDGQEQTRYARKNWSSVMIFNCDHEANARLTVEMVNTLPGRDLHAFCWLKDDEIGSLPQEWNWLAGYSDPNIDPKIVHHTDGAPFMPGYENAPYADEWRKALNQWASK